MTDQRFARGQVQTIRPAQGPEIRGGALAASFPGREAERDLLERPDAVETYFREWVVAGAEILLAPTLHATPFGLKPLGCAAQCWELNKAALELLQEVVATTPRGVIAGAALGCSEKALVGGQIGPFYADDDDPGSFLFDRMYAQYHEQMKPLAMAGMDLVVVRHIADARVLRAALVAVRELWSGPTVVLLDALRSCVPILDDIHDVLECFGAVGEEFDLRVVEAAPAPESAGVDRVPPSTRAHQSPLGQGAYGPKPQVVVTRRVTVLDELDAAAAGHEVVGENVDHAVARGFHVVPQGAPIDPFALEVNLRSIERSTGVGGALAASDPRLLESCAKGTYRTPRLVFEENIGLDCALYLTRRYGARAVLRRAGSGDLEGAVAEWCAAITAIDPAAPWDRIAFDVSRLVAPDITTDVLAEVLASLRMRYGVGFAWVLTRSPGETLEEALGAVPARCELDVVVVED